MSLLLETIHAAEGKILHVNYHQARLEYSLKQLGLRVRHNLLTLLHPPVKGVYRCRVVYDEQTCTVEYLPYVPKKIKTLKVIEAPILNYGLKYADRSALDALFQLRGHCDDIAIIQNGFLSDTTIANIALFDGKQWCTPTSPLLHGTTRQRLLDTKKIIEKPIPLSSIERYQKSAVFNAMMGFVELEDGIIF
ncbi:MAG: hypothetical protein DSZ03_02440 [Sulfurimonas sp.]|nr:MAG: hypothetical protein DSZ03_02440 [Sulfurimonas sp.]